MVWPAAFCLLRRPGARVALLLFASLIVVGSVRSAHAQCVPFDQRMPAANIDMLKVDPGSALDNIQNNKARIADRIAGYLETDPDLLKEVRKLVAKVPSETRIPIGAGLRRAALQCDSAQKPQVTRNIEKFVRDLNDRQVSAGYFAVTEEPEFSPAPPRPAPDAQHSGGSLLGGEWNTEISDPFAAVPVPLTTDSATQ